MRWHTVLFPLIQNIKPHWNTNRYKLRSLQTKLSASWKRQINWEMISPDALLLLLIPSYFCYLAISLSGQEGAKGEDDIVGAGGVVQ